MTIIQLHKSYIPVTAKQLRESLTDDKVTILGLRSHSYAKLIVDGAETITVPTQTYISSNRDKAISAFTK